LEGSNAHAPGGELVEYRTEIVRLHGESQKSYDKTIVTLSAGALGLSLAFVHDLLGDAPMQARTLLLASWGAWCCSLAVILLSHLTSVWALKATISQIDSGKIFETTPGGGWSTVTTVLNILGGLLFLVGVVLLLLFVEQNL
jgi:hypothetical protein